MMFLWESVALAGLAGVLYAVLILMVLSKKLGEVARMRPYYRLFYLATALIALAIASRVFRALEALTSLLGPEAPPWLHQSQLFYTLTYYIPLALGVTISLAVIWQYWGWLVKER